MKLFCLPGVWAGREEAHCFRTAGFCLDVLDYLLPNQAKSKVFTAGFAQSFTNKIKCKHAFDVQAVS